MAPNSFKGVREPQFYPVTAVSASTLVCHEQYTNVLWEFVGGPFINRAIAGCELPTSSAEFLVNCQKLMGVP